MFKNGLCPVAGLSCRGESARKTRNCIPECRAKLISGREHASFAFRIAGALAPVPI